MARIHILLGEADKARFRRQAEREGKALGAWIREAAEEKLSASGTEARLESVDDLRRFFERCDARERGAEPDWSEQRRVIERSRTQGLEVT